ncbi:hypothetical protein TNCT_115551 [Trichonephila clavata]|uniref:Uncharacterized protein n=1 Tax=Trichonephila clavata TaxID=2740835 RepID=A0A8X6I289_TRICU|nr:hypothetical protein TNCT_115551 [Trichonephila clavata]
MVLMSTISVKMIILEARFDHGEEPEIQWLLNLIISVHPNLVTSNDSFKKHSILCAFLQSILLQSTAQFPHNAGSAAVGQTFHWHTSSSNHLTRLLP